MDNTEKAVIEILKAYLYNMPFTMTEIDLKKLSYIINIHNLQGIAYTVLKDSDIDRAYIESLKGPFYAIIQKNLIMDAEMQKVIKVFNDNNIIHIPIKGYAVKICYRDPELRTMGDVDVLIRDCDRKKSDKLLRDMGYEIDKFSSFNHVWNYNNSKLYLEMHTRLIHEKLFNDYDYISYFSDAIKHSVQKDGCTYELTPEYHLLFLIMHMAKHFYGEGCGLRLIYDIPMFINYYKDNINWDFLFEELKKIKLIKFAFIIFSLCQKWFDIEYPYKIDEIDDVFYDKLSKYVFEGGVFGFENRNQGAVKLRREIKAGESGLKRKVHQIYGVLKWLCPGYKNMQERAIWFKGKPKILLPVAWLQRWIMAVKIRRGGIFKKLLSILNGNKDASYQLNILAELGLYEK